MKTPILAAGLLVLMVAGDVTGQDSRPIELRVTVLLRDGGPTPPDCSVTLREGRGRRRGADSGPAPEMTAAPFGAGGFRIQVQKPGNYVLTVLAAGYARERQLVTLTDRTAIDVTLAPALKLAGHVLDAETRKPIQGARVSASGGGMADPIAAISADGGAFSLDGLSAGTEDLRIIATARGHAPREVPVEQPLAADGITILLDAAWRASVKVIDDRGQPVSGALVRARLPFAVAYSNLERHDFEARSSKFGVAAFDELIPGEPVVFEIADESHVATRSGVVMPHAPADGQAPPDAEIVLTEGRTANVAVHDAFGAPIDIAVVRVLPLVEPRLDFGGASESETGRGSVRSGRVDSAGKVAFENLPAEILTIEVRARDYETRMVALDLRSVASADADVRLDRDPSPPDRSMPWIETVRDAFGTANASKLPVMVAMAMDGERANEWMAAHHFKDPEVIRVAEFIPCLLSSVFGEGGVHAGEVEHGEHEGVCSRYGTIPCSAHQAVEAYARAELLPDVKSFQVPRHIMVTADGRVLEHRAYYLSERDLRWMMLRALRASDSDAAVWLAIRRLQPLWRALCDGGDSDERRAAVAILASLVASGDEYAILLLQDFALEEMPAAVRIQVLEALLLPAIADPVRALKGFLRDPEATVRLRAWERLESVSSRLDVAAAVPLIANLEHDETVMTAALKALRVEAHGTGLVVADADQGDRWMLVEMLADRIECSSLQGVDAILEHQGTEGRNRVLRALAAVSDDDSSVRRVFAHASLPDSGAVAAIRALSDTDEGLNERGRDLLRSQALSQNPLVRQEALTQLGRHQVEKSIPIMIAALEDAALPVRIAAAIALWHQGNRRGASILVDAIGDPEFGGTIRGLLQTAYSDSAPRDPDAWRRWLTEQGVIPKGN